MAGKKLEFVGVSKSYGRVEAVKDVSFSVSAGEFFSILGPSGCGKTTLLRLVAGFEHPDKGRIFLGGEDITNLPPHKRPINTVFQSYALFPHLSLFENIAFGLRIQKKTSLEINREVDKMLKLIQMEDHAHKKPDQISGGQKQRVAIARALINKPRLLLLDEPLAALDLKLRQKLLLELELFHDEVGITFVYVTHDQSEAMAVSDKIAVINHGQIEQLGTPRELYEQPKSSFVAAFIGDTNFLDGIVSEKINNEYSILEIEDFPKVLCYNDKQLATGDLVHLSIRPEKIHISKERPKPNSNFNVVEGIVDEIVYKGDHSKYWVSVDGYRLAVIQQHYRFLEEEHPIFWDDKVFLFWHADDGFMLERYSVQDESLTQMPSEKIGQETEGENESET
jgi:spermidine/putrescine transport system ATP-binding protein